MRGRTERPVSPRNRSLLPRLRVSAPGAFHSLRSLEVWHVRSFFSVYRCQDGLTVQDRLAGKRHRWPFARSGRWRRDG
jgi:hypothetical protein